MTRKASSNITEGGATLQQIVVLKLRNLFTTTHTPKEEIHDYIRHTKRFYHQFELSDKILDEKLMSGFINRLQELILEIFVMAQLCWSFSKVYRVVMTLEDSITCLQNTYFSHRMYPTTSHYSHEPQISKSFTLL